MDHYKVHRINFVPFTPKSIDSIAVDTYSNHVRCALSREDGAIEIRNVEMEFAVEKVIPGHDDRAREQLAWCKGRLFSAGLSGEIIEWDLEKLRPKHTENSNGGPVWCIAFSNDNTMMAVGCEDGSVRVFEVLHIGIFYQKCLYKQEDRVLSLSWGYDNNTLVTGGADSTIRIYDVKTGRITSRITSDTVKKNKTRIWAVGCLKDMTIVTGSSTGHTQFWDMNSGTLISSFKSHEADVLTVAIGEEQNTVYSTGVDSRIMQFKKSSGQYGSGWVMNTLNTAVKHDLRAMKLCSQPHNFLVCGGIDPRLVVYNLDRCSHLRWDVKLLTHIPRKNVCQLAPSANVLLAQDLHSIHLWKLGHSGEQNVKKLCEVKSDKANHVLCSAISKCGGYVSYSTVVSARLLEINTDIETCKINRVPIRLLPVTAMTFSSDSQYFVGTTFESELQVVDFVNAETKNLKLPRDRNICYPIQHIALSHGNENLCLVDSLGDYFIFKFSSDVIEYTTKAPKLVSKMSWCRFSPFTSNLLLADSCGNVYEFNPTNDRMSTFYKASQFTKSTRSTLTFCFNPQNLDEMFFQLESGLTKVKPTDLKRKKFYVNKLSSGFKEILFLDFTSSGDLVMVESKLSDVFAKLPAPMKPAKKRR